MRRQGTVPQYMGELALDIPFLISLKIELSFIPMHVHACIPPLMAQPKINPLNKNESSDPPNRFSELPSLLSFISLRKRHEVPHFRPFSALHPQNSAPLLPSIHPRASGTAGHRLLPITLQQRSQPGCGSPSRHSPLQRGKSSALESTRKSFPPLLVTPEKPYYPLITGWD